MKTVCQLDDFGFFVKTTEADESPLEPGVFLVPGRCVDAAPPDTSAPRTAHLWGGAAWQPVPDWRGLEYWMPDGSRHTIQARGVEPPPDHLLDAPITVEPAPVTVVSMRQARLALLAAGLLDDANAAVAAAGQAAQIEWEFSNEVRRDNALIAALAGPLGLDAAALDALFEQAATL
jgi:hypothetical protein